MMGRYKTITLRVAQDDKDVLEWLAGQESMNMSIINLIRQELGIMKQEPEEYEGHIKEYEVIEERGRFRVSLASFSKLEEAHKFAKIMFDVFDDTQRIMIVHRKYVKCGDECICTGRVIGTLKNKKVLSDFDKKEEKENA